MFSFDGQLSMFGQCVRHILGELREITDPLRDDSFTLVLYRVDPKDNYEYIAGCRGLREPEPMFGPRQLKDFSFATAQSPGANVIANPRGFRAREGIEGKGQLCKCYSFGTENNKGYLWVSKRGKSKWSDFEKHERKTDFVRSLDEVFASYSDSGTPLYPDLWFEERQDRDKLRSSVFDISPRPEIDTVAGTLSADLLQCYAKVFPGSADHFRVGIYLFTGKGWALCGGQIEPGILPATIDMAASLRAADPRDRQSPTKDRENAFEWVHHSVRPVLVRAPVSKRWVKRIDRCGMRPLQSNDSLCIVPILDYLDQTQAIGILAVSARGTSRQLSPAHVFLASRLSFSVAGYLGPLLPIPGYPWWPDGKLSRGRANVAPGRRINQQVQEIIGDLMPTGSEVSVEELSGGLTDTKVMLLKVTDETRIPEIPRVMKIGPHSLIGDELRRYYLYVHNKIVGGHSRVDIARGYPQTSWAKVKGRVKGNRNNTATADGEGIAAIVYTLVGPGEDARPWSQWAGQLDINNWSEIELGIHLVMKQLDAWHGLRCPLDDVVKRVITEEIMDKQEDRAADDVSRKGKAGPLENPSIAETVTLLKDLQEGRCIAKRTFHASIVHGDTHANNLFALCDDDGRLRNVALIDWGKVNRDCHPLTDIAILIADLMFRVLWDPTKKQQILKWGLDQYVQRFEPAHKNDLTQRSHAWLVMAVHLCRMLAWRDPSTATPWFKRKARTAAWTWLKDRLREAGLIDKSWGEQANPD